MQYSILYYFAFKHSKGKYIVQFLKTTMQTKLCFKIRLFQKKISVGLANRRLEIIYSYCRKQELIMTIIIEAEMFCATTNK